MTATEDNIEAVYPETTLRIAGVFKGGGAKGLVYGAALQELRARGIWFDAAAGSSAGAITAALVAAGYSPSQLIAFTADALAQLKRNRLGSLGYGGDGGMFATSGLEAWLEDRLRWRIADEVPSPVTFRQLHDVTGFDLYVVAMDLASAQPIVFHHVTSPEMSVTQAVMASSAIPVAMRPRRVWVREGEQVAIHRLVDGGVWANYPRFVFSDSSFRAFNGLDQWLQERTVVGFTIEGTPYGLAEYRNGSAELASFGDQLSVAAPWPATQPQPAPVVTREIRPASPRLSIFDHGSGRRLGTAGAVLTWMALRRTLAVVLLLIGILLVPTLWPRMSDRMTDALPLAVSSPLQLGAWVLVVGMFAAAVLYALVEVRYIGEAAENGLPAIRAALSVGPGVPDWVGTSPDDHVVRMHAPIGIKTTSFTPTRQVVMLGLAVAGAQASSQLDGIFPRRPRKAEVPAAHLLGDGPHMTDLELKAAHAHMLGVLVSESQPRARDGGATFVVAFWFMLFGAVALAFDWPDIYVGLLAGVAFVYWLSKRLALGRQLNQSMLLPIPSRQRVWGRAAWTVAAGGLSWLVAVAAEDAQENLFIGPLLGLLMLSAIGSALSVASRLLVNRRRQRYLHEIAV